MGLNIVMDNWRLAYVIATRTRNRLNGIIDARTRRFDFLDSFIDDRTDAQGFRRNACFVLGIDTYDDSFDIDDDGGGVLGGLWFFGFANGEGRGFKGSIPIEIDLVGVSDHAGGDNNLRLYGFEVNGYGATAAIARRKIGFIREDSGYFGIDGNFTLYVDGDLSIDFFDEGRFVREQIGRASTGKITFGYFMGLFGITLLVKGGLVGDDFTFASNIDAGRFARDNGSIYFGRRVLDATGASALDAGFGYLLDIDEYINVNAGLWNPRLIDPIRGNLRFTGSFDIGDQSGAIVGIANEAIS